LDTTVHVHGVIALIPVGMKNLSVVVLGYHRCDVLKGSFPSFKEAKLCRLF